MSRCACCLSAEVVVSNPQEHSEFNGLKASWPSSGPPASRRDVDYTFGQVDIDTPFISYSGLCGNISSGVAPFAIEEGLVRAVEPVTTVRVYSKNTGQIYITEVR